jgi:hypothetical protein
VNHSLQSSLTHRHPGFRALGYFWLVLLGALAGGAGLLQYSYVPSLQAGRGAGMANSGVSGFDAVMAPARSAEPSPAPWARPVRETPPPLLIAAVTLATTDARDPVENPSFSSGASTPVQDIAMVKPAQDFAPGATVPGSAPPAENAAFGSTQFEAAPAAVSNLPAPDSGMDVRPAAPPPAASPAALPMASGALAKAMVQRADALLHQGDVSAARLLYARAAAGGSGQAATAMGKTFDPAFLAEIGVVGLSADPALAGIWYRLALGLGDEEGRARLQLLTPAASRVGAIQEARP